MYKEKGCFKIILLSFLRVHAKRNSSLTRNHAFYLSISSTIPLPLPLSPPPSSVPGRCVSIFKWTIKKQPRVKAHHSVPLFVLLTLSSTNWALISTSQISPINWVGYCIKLSQSDPAKLGSKTPTRILWQPSSTCNLGLYIYARTHTHIVLIYTGNWFATYKYNLNK